jgi:M6 family metalloprotease-like protein
MKISLVLLAVVLLLVLCSDLFAVFPSRPVLGPDEKPLPAKNFIEQPRMMEGKRYMAAPTEKILVLLVDFPADTYDDPETEVVDTCAAVTFHAGHDTAYYRQKIFTETVGSHSMDEYWDECSLGNMDITGTVFGPYTMPHSMKYYGWDTQNVIDDGWNDDAGNTDGKTCKDDGVTGTCRLIEDACDAADPDVDFCDFDADGDSLVDHVMVIHAGRGQEMGNVSPSNIWSWFYGDLDYGPYDVEPNHCAGDTVHAGFIVPEFYSDPDSVPLGVWCHEFSHSIGNPDLYDPDGGSASVPDDNDYPVMDWCLMGHGSWCGPTGNGERPSHLTAFNKAGTGWVNVMVLKPTKNKTDYDVYDLETPFVPGKVNEAQALRIDVSQMRGEYFLIENRDIRDANTSFDKFDSDWSAWTGQGGPDSLDCGLIVSHIMTMHNVDFINQGTCGYDYMHGLGDTCPCDPAAYEVWIEDPGYNDTLAADWNEWWYPWEVKAGAAYADSSADDPHYLFDAANRINANCTRTASSIDNLGQVTNISVEARSDCGNPLTARVFVPGWVENPGIEGPIHFCSEWALFHKGITSGGWGYGGGFPNIDAPFEARMEVAWVQPGPTQLRSSPVITNTEVEVQAGKKVKGLAVVATSAGIVVCYSAKDGAPVWSTTIGIPLRSTPIACDTLYGWNDVSVVLNRVIVSTMNGRLYFLNLLNGQVQGYWPEPTSAPLEADPRIGMVENPYIPGNYQPLIFVGSLSGTMYAINALTMSEQWNCPVGAPIRSPAAMGIIRLPTENQKGNPAVMQWPRMDAIFFGDASGFLRCVSAFDGYPLWSANLGANIMASPATCDSVTQDEIMWQSDQMVIAATTQGKVFARDATNGRPLWEYDTPSGQSIVSSPSVAVDRVHNWGMLWFQSFDGTVCCLHLGKPRGGARVIWSYSDGSPGTSSSPGVVLPYGMLPLGFDTVGNPVFPPACATGDPKDDGVVYIGSSVVGGGGGRILALNAADGTPVWEWGVPQNVDASPAPTLGMMFISADLLYAFEPNAEAGVESKGLAGLSLDLKIGPNPVRPSTMIECSIPVATRVSLKVYDVRGRLVESIFDGSRAAGVYRMEWGGRDDNGANVAAGIYFVKLDTDRGSVIKKAVLVR